MINVISEHINQIDSFVAQMGNIIKTWRFVVHPWNTISLEVDLSIHIENMVIGPSNGQQYIICISNTINLHHSLFYNASVIIWHQIDRFYVIVTYKPIWCSLHLFWSLHKSLLGLLMSINGHMGRDIHPQERRLHTAQKFAGNLLKVPSHELQK